MRLYDLRARAQGGSSGATAADASGASHDWISTFHGHSAPVFGLDFSPDNQLLFSASGDGTVRWGRHLAAVVHLLLARLSRGSGWWAGPLCCVQSGAHRSTHASLI